MKTEIPFFLNYRAGIYYYSFNGNYPEAKGLCFDVPKQRLNHNFIGIATADYVLESAESEADCINSEKTHFYDSKNKRLYVHLFKGYSPRDHKVYLYE